MTKFKKKIFKKGNAVHCKTQKQAMKLLKYADSKGYSWTLGDSYLNYNNWGGYREETCYYLNDGEYGNLDYARNNGDNILKYKDCIKAKK